MPVFPCIYKGLDGFFYQVTQILLLASLQSQRNLLIGKVTVNIHQERSYLAHSLNGWLKFFFLYVLCVKNKKRDD